MSRLDVPDDVIRKFNKIGWQKVFDDAEKRIKRYKDNLSKAVKTEEKRELIGKIRLNTVKLKRLREYYNKRVKTCKECGIKFVPVRSGHDVCYDCWFSE